MISPLTNKILGEGAFGVARKAIENDTGEVRAVKTIHKNKIRNQKRFINEVQSLKTLDHPNIIKLYDIYEDDEEVHLVTEFWSGGELFEFITNQDCLDEHKTAKIFEQILHSILYCHKNAICHRDLKPENFMFESKDPNSNLKLIDFGMATSYFLIDDMGDMNYTKMNSTVGTAYFMAPEIFYGNYSQAWDLWSAGVILYIMLCGWPPFDGNSEQEVLEAVKVGHYIMDDEIWQEISDEAKDLVRCLLCNEDERISPKEALKHPWFLKTTEKPEKTGNL